ncbi:nitrite reductase small subunit NirD [Chromohalobacter nigrandesensis]|uniref:nitrite reductase small subunit NirD n=1 Tax=Chromohalobacter nigrandesensis TaxID=119863 RepID=UPI001FF1858A|nr:nitrite reductase small subunit NirD [Chromohalobacter nigrandesensis]MCK0744239.1 nitrite reductase small subunit NirD [Chromohalobacter nigrandesensis]
MSTATVATPTMTQTWQTLCSRADLVTRSGVAAWLASADTQVALLYLPGQTPEVYAVDNHDPFSNANVIARGIVGDIQGEPVIASPIYKQHFRLADGVCVEDENVRLRTWEVKIEGDDVMIRA